MALSPEIVNDVGHTDVIQLPAAGLSALTQPSFNLSALAQGFPNGNQPNSLTLVDGRRFDYHDHRTINTGQPEIQRLNSEVSKWSHAYHEEVKSHKSALKRKDNDLRTKDAEIQRLNTELSNYTYWYNEELALHNATKLANESDIERLNHLNNYFRWYNEEVKSHGATKKSLKRVKEEKAAEVKTSQRLRNERTDLEQRLSKKKSANANLANEKAGLERRIAVLEAQKCELEQRTRVADAGGSDWYEYATVNRNRHGEAVWGHDLLWPNPFADRAARICDEESQQPSTIMESDNRQTAVLPRSANSSKPAFDHTGA